jgi:hypothetical protein
MQHCATLAGVGWLRVPASVSSTARYQLDISRRSAGAEPGAFVTKGMLAAELMTMIEARAAGRAVLLLSNGEAVAVQLLDLFGPEAAFIVLGRMPKF